MFLNQLYNNGHVMYKENHVIRIHTQYCVACYFQRTKFRINIVKLNFNFVHYDKINSLHVSLIGNAGVICRA